MLFAAVCVPYVLLAWRFWFVTDDAYISFRYARNLALGHGLRYNLWNQPPVEGYSNFLWVLVCSVFEFLRLDMTFWPLLVSLACGGVVLWLVLHMLRDELGASAPAAGLATLALACFPPFALWASGGLATMPFTLLLLLLFERLVSRRGGPDVLGGTLAGLGLVLIRIEGIGWFVVIVVIAAVSWRMRGRRVLRPLGICLAIVVAGYATYFAWRYAYYGLPLPNTAYAKAALDVRRLGRGVNYAVTFLLTFISPIVLLPAGAAALRRNRRPLGLAVLTMVVAFVVYAIVVTGDFMAMGRFFVPAAPFGAILLAWLLEDLMRGGVTRRVAGVVTCAAVIAFGLLPGWNVHVVPRRVRERFRFRFNTRNYETEFDRWQSQKRNVAQWRGRALRIYADRRGLHDPIPTCVAGAIGAVGYYSGYNIYDMYGLVTAEVGRRKLRADEPLRSPGHDKGVDREYFLKYTPTVWDARLLGDTPQPLAAEVCRRQAEKLRDLHLADRYVVDCLHLPDDFEHGEYLVVTVRIASGTTPKAAWARFRKLVRDLAAGRRGAKER